MNKLPDFNTIYVYDSGSTVFSAVSERLNKITQRDGSILDYYRYAKTVDLDGLSRTLIFVTENKASKVGGLFKKAVNKIKSEAVYSEQVKLAVSQPTKLFELKEIN